MDETDKRVRDRRHSEADCEGLTDVLSSVGDKWTIMVIGALAHGTLRYNEIERRVRGISQRRLTLTLKRLELDGLIRRTLYPSVPARVEYYLTELGLSLRGALEPLHLWALTHRDAIERNRQTNPGQNLSPKQARIVEVASSPKSALAQGRQRSSTTSDR